MNESKVKFGVLVLVMVILIWCIPVAGAENTTGEGNLTNQTLIATASSETPFITIDPIGNHTIGDVFFVEGTTTLSVSDNRNLSLGIAPDYPTPAGPRYSFRASPAIVLGSNGINQWSVNVTDFARSNPGVWLVVIGVYDNNVPSIDSQEQSFTILSPATTTLSSSPPLQFTQQETQISSSISLATTNTSLTPVPTTQYSPLSVLLSISSLAGIVAIYKKKRGL
jgi:hypothetical protein